jgi:arylsulfatase A-like enzyme
MTSRILSGILFILICILSACTQVNNQQADKPNILLIVVDDQGYADFSPFENHCPEISTPNMQRLADAGMIFTEAYATSPVCSPSRAGMNTGKLQFRWDTKASWGPGLPDSTKTIAEYLKEAGYETARIGKADFGTNYHKFDVREHPLNHGYDYFLGFSAHAHDFWLHSKEIAERTPDPNGTSAHLGPLMENNSYRSFSDDEYLTDIFTNEAIKYLKKEKEKPFFLTLSYNSVHHVIHEVPKKYLDKYEVEPIHNYEPDSMESFNGRKPGTYSDYYEKYTRLGAINEENMRKYYLANLNCLDDNLGRVLDALQEQELDRNTIVIYVSDNGGSPLTAANNAPLTAGKYSLWEGGIRVPMAISWPGIIEPGSVQNQYVSALDILPTLAKPAGFEISDPIIDGINLLQPNPNRLLVWRWMDAWAVRQGDFKLTNMNRVFGKGPRPSAQFIEPIQNDNSLKLFNLKSDPGERKNLAEEMPEKVQELKNAYNNWMVENSGDY